MNKALAIIIVFILVILGFYFYWAPNHQTSAKSSDFIPDDALIAFRYHKNSPTDPTTTLIKSFLPDSLHKTLLEINELFVSVHIISKDELGYIFYLPDSPWLEEKINSIIKSSTKSRERVFDSFKIVEIPAGEKLVSTSTINEVRVISSSSLLIEDVIRLANTKELNEFSQRHNEIHRFVQTKADSGDFYFDFTQLARVCDLFRSEKNTSPILDRFAASAVIEIKKQKQGLLFSGFAVDSLADGLSFLSTFNRQRPVPIRIQNVVSNRTGFLAHFGIIDAMTWNQDRLEFGKKIGNGIPDSLRVLQDNYSFDVNRFYATLGNELGLCQSGIFSGTIFITEMKDKTYAASCLQKLKHTSEIYAHYQIHKMDNPFTAATLFWPLVVQKMNYYLIADRYLIFSERLEDLKSFVSDIDSDNTWGKSSEWNEFLSTTPDTNVGVIVDAAAWWPFFRNELNTNWKNFGDSTRFFNFEKCSFQFSRLEKSYYLNGTLKLNSKKIQATSKTKEQSLEVDLPSSIGSPATVVKNHITRRSEILVQDESNTLRLFSSGLKSLFAIKLDGKIRSEIQQIDFFRNKKLQYVFATDKNIFLIDRLGNLVKGFPKSIVFKNPVQFLSVVDYDHTKNYRYLICDSKGTLSQFDRDGKILPDWNKIELNSELLAAPRSLRAMGKDYLMAITRDGMVHRFNRKGEPTRGFPLNLKLRPSGNWFLESNNDREVITVISEDGMEIQLDSDGNVINKANLIKSSSSSRFALVVSHDGDHCVVSRIDKGNISVLSIKGDVLLTKQNPGSNEMFLTYFDLGAGRKVFCFTDPQQEFNYLFDEKGTSLFSNPLESQKAPSVIGDKPGEENYYFLNKNSIRSFRPGGARR